MINNIYAHQPAYQAYTKINPSISAVIRPLKASFDTVSFGANLQPKQIVNFANELSGDILKTHLFKLTSPETEGRGVGSQGIEIAKDYIAKEFEKLQLEPVKKLGLTDFLQKFETKKYETNIGTVDSPLEGELYKTTYNPLVPSSNVIGMIKGTKYPNDYVILTAHYDHLGKDMKKNIIFPGADDNASSVSTLLEIARIMKKSGQNEKSIIFAALSGEESGKRGAVALANSISKNGLAKNIEIMNVEMLGATGGETLDIWKERQNLSENLVGGIKEACKALKIETRIHNGGPLCDAVVFNNGKLPSVCVAWDFLFMKKPKANPNAPDILKTHPFYHTAADTAENVNMNVFEKAAKLISAATYVLVNKSPATKKIKNLDVLDKVA